MLRIAHCSIVLACFIHFVASTILGLLQFLGYVSMLCIEQEQESYQCLDKGGEQHSHSRVYFSAHTRANETSDNKHEQEKNAPVSPAILS